MTKRKTKIGRNELCPCGSSKKYKRCHGDLNKEDARDMDETINSMLDQQKMGECQRQKQQGLGKPIISTMHGENRIIFVGNKPFVGTWKTFQDFLLDHLKKSIGEDWGNAELIKSYEDRHPLMKMYDEVCRYQRKTILKPGEVHSASMIGVVEAYLYLSYNLYLIWHNVSRNEVNLKSMDKLLKRLRENRSEFLNTCYEIHVIANFIRAGFELEFEDESNNLVTHCEFTATHIKTARKCSVESKQRKRKNELSKDGTDKYELDSGITRNLRAALKKSAKHERIIFIDMNLPSAKLDSYSEEDVFEIVEKMGAELKAVANPVSAYVFLTNYPYHYDIRGENYKTFFAVDAINIPDFGPKETTLHEAIKTRKKHQHVYDLLKSFKEHRYIPSTFDGQIPEYFFGESQPRFRIGQKYQLEYESGQITEAVLEAATINEMKKEVIGFYRTNENKIIIKNDILSDAEFLVYRQYPDCFFGRYQEQLKQAQTPLEWYDFFYHSFNNLNKEELLKRLSKHPDFFSLKEKDKEGLLEVYCEELAVRTWKV